jgi:hypothetical protein
MSTASIVRVQPNALGEVKRKYLPQISSAESGRTVLRPGQAPKLKRYLLSKFQSDSNEVATVHLP